MRKFIFLFSLIISLHFAKAQQYTQNQFFDSTLYDGHYVNAGCTQFFDTNIQLDTSLFNYVDGMTFMILIDSVYYPGPPGGSPIDSGDTIILNSINPVFSLPVISGLEYWFRIELTGTPGIANQSYHCNIDVDQCTCFCMEILIQASSFDTSTCYVSSLNSVTQINKNRNAVIYPSPAINELTIDNPLFKPEYIEIIDVTGKTIKSGSINTNKVNILNLPSGIYFIKLVAENKIITQKFVKQ